jgi:hypothetical protein
MIAELTKKKVAKSNKFSSQTLPPVGSPPSAVKLTPWKEASGPLPIALRNGSH